MRHVLILLTLALAFRVEAAPDGAPDGPMRAGLIRNETGLPATFPLQVKTAPGRDYLLTLRRPDSGETALTAYIRGGAFFKVLVPPGTFTLQFAHGTEWQGPEQLFGPDTGAFSLHTPLTFRIDGPARKAGHLVDLTGLRDSLATGVKTRPQVICQALRTEYVPPSFDGKRSSRQGSLQHPDDQFPAFRYEVRDRYCR